MSDPRPILDYATPRPDVPRDERWRLFALGFIFGTPLAVLATIFSFTLGGGIAAWAAGFGLPMAFGAIYLRSSWRFGLAIMLTPFVLLVLLILVGLILKYFGAFR